MGSLTVHVLDEDGNPVQGKIVTCIFPGTGLLGIGTNSESYTDDGGVAEFDDVPTCTVEVHVDGSLQVEVGVGEGDYEDVTVTL